jgi:hypothetical protein
MEIENDIYEEIVNINTSNSHNNLSIIDSSIIDKSFNTMIYLKLNLYNKNHNVLYDYIVKNINDFDKKNHYFKIIENNNEEEKDLEPELITTNIQYNDFKKIAKYLINIENNKINVINQNMSEIDLSLPEKDLIFMLF